jgi:hypothetical protein
MGLVMRKNTIIAAVLCSIAAGVVPCHAQEASRITGSVFTNPGARSIGLGGAFAAVADDATAAFANPAGLTQILRPEISIELRFTASHNDEKIDPDQGVSGLGFFSFVLPARRWALAVYSHQMGSVAFGFNGLESPVREFTVRSYAAAAAIEITEDLSLGAGLSCFNGDRSSAAGVTGFSDSDWGFNAGLLWKASIAWNVAGFYRQGPEFESSEAPSQFSFPDRYGIGVAFRPEAGALTVGFEWDHVGSMTDPRHIGHVAIESGSEYHLGIEYAVLRWKPVVAFRTGWWRESGRQYDVVHGPGWEQSFSIEDRNHVAFGFGLAFKRFQIDAGVDFIDADFVGSASFVYSF